MKLVVDAEGGQWEKATTEYERIMATAATKAMRQIGKLAEKAARQAVGAAGFTSNVQRTIQALNKPPSGYVLNPRVWLHSTVNYLDVFETGKTITGSPYCGCHCRVSRPIPVAVQGSVDWLAARI